MTRDVERDQSDVVFHFLNGAAFLPSLDLDLDLDPLADTVMTRLM